MVDLFRDQDRVVEVHHARAVLVVDDVRVVLRLHDVIGAVRRGREGELAGHHVAELLLEHVEEQHVELGIGAVRQSVQLVHVVRERASLGCLREPSTYVDFVKVIVPLLSLRSVVERNELLLHVVVRLDMVVDEIGGLLSQLSFGQVLGSYLISCVVVGIRDNFDLSGNVDVVVDPRDKRVRWPPTRM